MCINTAATNESLLMEIVHPNDLMMRSIKNHTNWGFEKILHKKAMMCNIKVQEVSQSVRHTNMWNV